MTKRREQYWLVEEVPGVPVEERWYASGPDIKGVFYFSTREEGAAFFQARGVVWNLELHMFEFLSPGDIDVQTVFFPPGCNNCPHSMGDAYERDCAYPDCANLRPSTNFNDPRAIPAHWTAELPPPTFDGNVTQY